MLAPGQWRAGYQESLSAISPPATMDSCHVPTDPTAALRTVGMLHASPAFTLSRWLSRDANTI